MMLDEQKVSEPQLLYPLVFLLRLLNIEYVDSQAFKCRHVSSIVAILHHHCRLRQAIDSLLVVQQQQ